MGIAFDATASSNTATSQLSWTHTPVGTPRGVSVLVVQNVGATDEVTGVTYGGTALSEITGSPLLHTTGAEDSALYGYHLGASVPTGAQVVNVNVNATGSTKRAVSCTVTADADTVVESTATLDSGGVANPSVTLSLGPVRTFIFGALHSGQGAIGGIAAGANYTELFEGDFGAQTAAWERRTAIAEGPNDVIVTWTATSEEAGVIALAVRQSFGDPVTRLTIGRREHVFYGGL